MSQAFISTEQIKDTARALRECSRYLHALHTQARAEAEASREYYARGLQWAATFEAGAEPSHPQSVVPSAVEALAGELARAVQQCLHERATHIAAERRRLEVMHEHEINQIVARSSPHDEQNTDDETDRLELEALEEEECRLQELRADLETRVRALQRRHESTARQAARTRTETAVMQAYITDRPVEVLDYAKYLLGLHPPAAH